MRFHVRTLSLLVGAAFASACGGGGAEVTEPEPLKARTVGGSDVEPSPPGEEPDTTLFFNLTSGVEDPHALYMALELAGEALERGRPVVLFFNVHAVPLVATTGPAELAFRGSRPLQAIVRDRIEAGAVALVCSHCMEATGVTRGELLQGAREASPEMVFDRLDADTVVITY